MDTRKLQVGDIVYFKSDASDILRRYREGEFTGIPIRGWGGSSHRTAVINELMGRPCTVSGSFSRGANKLSDGSLEHFVRIEECNSNLKCLKGTDVPFRESVRTWRWPSMMFQYNMKTTGRVSIRVL